MIEYEIDITELYYIKEEVYSILYSINENKNCKDLIKVLEKSGFVDYIYTKDSIDATLDSIGLGISEDSAENSLKILIERHSLVLLQLDYKRIQKEKLEKDSNFDSDEVLIMLSDLSKEITKKKKDIALLEESI